MREKEREQAEGEERRKGKREKEEQRSLRLTLRGGIITALAVKCSVKKKDKREFSSCRAGEIIHDHAVRHWR